MEWGTDLSAEAVAARRAAEEGRAAAAEKITGGAEDAGGASIFEGGGAGRASPAAAAASAADEEEEEAVVATLENLSVDDAAALEGASDALKLFMAEGTPTPEAIAEKAIRAQVNAGLPTECRVSIYCGAAFVEPAAAVFAGTKEGGAMGAVLEVISKTVAQQTTLIAACEAFCAVTSPASKAKFPVLLKNCYDNDALEEDTIVRWFNGPKRIAGVTCAAISDEALGALRKSAAPFYAWLQEAESSGSEEESSEEDAPAPAPKAAAATAAAPAPAPAAEESDSDSDFDMDDI